MTVHDKVTDLLKVEGGYSDDPNDRGGETFCGIARRFHPRWPGWSVIDGMKRAGQVPRINDSLRNMVDNFYQAEYWAPLGADHMPDAVASELFDQAVNMGLSRAKHNLQRTLNVLNRNAASWPEIKEDGLVGPNTLKTLGLALKQRNGERDVLKVLNTLQGAHYIRIVSNDPTQEAYLRGWLTRT